MTYYTKYNVIQLLYSACLDVGLDVSLVDSIYIHLEDCVIDTDDINDYDILDLGDDICDDFELCDVQKLRLDFRLAEILNIHLFFNFYFNGSYIKYL